MLKLTTKRIIVIVGLLLMVVALSFSCGTSLASHDSGTGALAGCDLVISYTHSAISKGNMLLFGVLVLLAAISSVAAQMVGNLFSKDPPQLFVAVSVSYLLKKHREIILLFRECFRRGIIHGKVYAHNTS